MGQQTWFAQWQRLLALARRARKSCRPASARRVSPPLIARGGFVGESSRVFETKRYGHAARRTPPLARGEANLAGIMEQPPPAPDPLLDENPLVFTEREHFSWQRATSLRP